MSRRSFHRASEAERRRDLIVATLDCIAECGLQNATVREIAARAGVTQGLIRHYFSSKDLMTKETPQAIKDLVESVRIPRGAGVAQDH